MPRCRRYHRLVSVPAHSNENTTNIQVHNSSMAKCRQQTKYCIHLCCSHKDTASIIHCGCHQVAPLDVGRVILIALLDPLDGAGHDEYSCLLNVTSVQDRMLVHRGDGAPHQVRNERAMGCCTQGPTLLQRCNNPKPVSNQTFLVHDVACL